ncbi:MAG TPA: carbohydrate kinase [Atribacter sp.]|uniref:5-dehydro-2-deoxygluconokinase n=1 Tax=Candidatus Atribacter allofermentans TaxID=1852833 RepID=A0A1V5T1W4_9BACT|nr:carbohydrate kinase [Atribacter sp.]OQA60767.1 MAG: 5-dehydro-2-deoxygluconokinase [Candidatus Atribacteria bacterium ADurb.Bin276]HOT04780.1 carbohydrate kinase [Atribacter sp.]HQK82487.1 carbohydrate kinase [Atribacter sp.]
MDKKAICLGELLIDFVSTLNGVTLRDAPGFEKAPGGAPANVAVGLSKLGIETYFIGKIGKDAFGDFLRMTLDKYGVKTNYLTTTTKAKTTLAFVSLTEEGERDFVFYRDPGADMLLDQSDIIDLIFSGSGVFHFGSITMTHEPSNSATFKAIQLARKYGYLVSFDPNLRPALWKTLDEAREKMRLGMELSDVVKLNEEEAMFIAETNTVEEAIRYLQRSYNLALVIITLGKEGSILVHQEKSLRVEGFPVHAVDTTGAGDGFVAGLISSLYMFWNDLRERKSIPDDTLRYAGRRANAVGALTTLKKGAIPALPTQEEVEIFIEENPL